MRYMFLVLLVVSASAFAQDGMYTLDQQSTDAAVNELNAHTFYLETGLTPGDWAKLSEPEKEKISAQVQCNEIHAQIDEQLALEHAGHVGFYNWRSLRDVENRKTTCGNMAYRLGESPNDTYPAEHAKQQAGAMKSERGMAPAPYPIEALRQGHQGTVLISVHVGADGSVSNPTVAQSSGYRELDRAALESAQKWRVDPSKGAVQTYPVNFSLNTSH